jgi:hypothetical protein
MSRPPVTAEEFNECNRIFWDDQNLLLRQRMASSATLDVALDVLRAEQIRGVPIRHQTSLYKALEDAESTGKRFLMEYASKGGKAKKHDALQILIEEIIIREPSISALQLAKQLEAYQGIDVIEDIADGSIWFTNGDRSKEAKQSGLKDRLLRAKRKLQSR